MSRPRSTIGGGQADLAKAGYIPFAPKLRSSRPSLEISLLECSFAMRSATAGSQYRMTISGTLDKRFSTAEQPIDWERVDDALAGAELYWLATVRKDGRPHVTPVVGVWLDDAFVFCTGSTEQKFRNLEHDPAVAVTTGTNTWKDGLDVVIEGVAQRVTGRDALKTLADAFREKYGDDWDFENDDEVFNPNQQAAHVFRVAPSKVIAFAKSPHGQTTFRF
jgi:PPOX class probable F420-dependent enzyme